MKEYEDMSGVMAQKMNATEAVSVYFALMACRKAWIQFYL